ncbi:MAG: transposase [Kiritimatiellia bacterium]
MPNNTVVPTTSKTNPPKSTKTMSNPLRNQNINYADGWFFVTMQVAHNKTMFGAITSAGCELNELGRQVGSAWEGMFARHPEAYRDEYVVMPNHFHAVIRIHPRPANKPNHLSYLLQGFKSFSTHVYHGRSRAGQCPDIGTRLWLSSYYDNLITSRRELENIRAYVRNNPARWDDDRFGPVTSHYCGNFELLHGEMVAYVASERQDTEALPNDTNRADTASHPHSPSRADEPPCPAVISTFTSPQERGVLAHCLAVRRPFVHVMPGGIPSSLPPAVARACADGWALVLSPVETGTGVNKQRSIWCNRYVLDHAAHIACGRIRPGGTLETLLQTRHQPISHSLPPLSLQSLSLSGPSCPD